MNMFVSFQEKLNWLMDCPTYEESNALTSEKDLPCSVTGLVDFLTCGVCTNWSSIFSGRQVIPSDLEKLTTKKVSDQSLKTLPNRAQPVAAPTQNPVCPSIVSVQMIGNEAPYNEFTDLIYFKNQFFCCFRESNDPQVGDNGIIRILSSPDAKTWTSVALISLSGYDLRDPKLSETPDGKLLLNLGATLWGSNGSESLNSAVSFSADGVNWGPVQTLAYPGQWLWHVAWNNQTAYGAAYSMVGSNTQLKLMSSPDGIHYSDLYQFNLPNNPNETTLGFLPDNTMVALVRCNDGPGLIGTAPPPYQQWTWFNTQSTLGGPDFLILKDGSMWASSRQVIGSDETCILAKMSLDSYKPILTFPGAGDCSYPGMVFKDGKLYVSYYSSQTGKACVYLATVTL